MANTTVTVCLRITRPTNNKAALLKSFPTGLGFKSISSFNAHAALDSIILGDEGGCYRLGDHEAGLAPTQDDLMVFLSSAGG
jgi:hypothetical protein